MTHSYVWHDTQETLMTAVIPQPLANSLCISSLVTWLKLLYRTWDTWLIHMCDITHRKPPRSSCHQISSNLSEMFILFHDSNSSSLYVIHSSLWHIWMGHGTYEWVMAHMNESWHIWMSPGKNTGPWHIWMSHGTYKRVLANMHESRPIWMSPSTYEWVMAHMNESWPIWIGHGTDE